MTITDFKAHALQVIGEVATSKKPVLVTKHGKPLAKVVPFTEKTHSPGKLSNTLVFEGDIVSPLGEEIWDACK